MSSKFYKKNYKTIAPTSIITAAIAAIIFFMFLIEVLRTYGNATENIALTIILSIIYLFVYIPYYWELAKKIIKGVFVKIHLKNGDILTNLFLSHRSFGKDLVLYDIDDDGFQRTVTVSKDEVLLILSSENMYFSDISETQKKIEDFNSKVINPSSGKRKKKKKKK